MNSTAATLGKPVDDLDKALNIRKHCIKCANKFFDTVYQSYSWDRKNKICGKNLLEIKLEMKFFA